MDPSTVRMVYATLLQGQRPIKALSDIWRETYHTRLVAVQKIQLAAIGIDRNALYPTQS